MRQLSLIALFGTLAILMGGCGGGENQTATSPSPTTPTATTPTTGTTPAATTPTTGATPTATTPTTGATPQQTPTQPFSSPMVDAKQKPKPTPGATATKPAPNIIVNAPPQLIQPTDPKQRVAQVEQQIAKANRDPFGLPPVNLNSPENQNPNRVPTQTQAQNRSIPTVAGVPLAQAPVVAIPGTTTAPTARNVPTVGGVPSARAPVVAIPGTTKAPTARNVPTVGGVPPAQAPVVGIPGANAPTRAVGIPGRARIPGRIIQQAPIASVPVSPGINRAGTPARGTTQQPRAVATPQRTQQPRAVATPQRTQQPRAVARVPQRTQQPRAVATPQRTQQPRAVAGVPQRTQQPRAVARAPQGNQTPNRTVATAPNPAVVAPPAPPEIPTLPPPPDPTLAKAVLVSGVVVVGTEPQAIVRAPDEASSRYVRAGQRLANGQVLVKRIEFNEGSEPVVVLEQNGVEVAKAVGERPAAPAQAQPGRQAVFPTPVTAKRQTNV